jgi:cytochrome b involved in lipid metabolism
MNKNIKICICITLMLILLIILYTSPIKKKIYGGEEDESESENLPVLDNIDCTMEQIKKHNTPNDKWVYNNGKIYDLTPIIEADIINSDDNIDNTINFLKTSDEQDLSKLFKSIESYNDTIVSYNIKSRAKKNNLKGDKDDFTIKNEIDEIKYKIKLYKFAKPKLTQIYVPTLSKSDRNAMIKKLKDTLKNETIDEDGPWKTLEDFDSSKLVLEWINKKKSEQSELNFLNDFNIEEDKIKKNLAELEILIDNVGFDVTNIEEGENTTLIQEQNRVFEKFKFILIKTLEQFSKGIICPSGLKI